MTQEDLAHVARAVLINRREREARLPGDIFADHAWEALLQLFVCEVRGHSVTVAQLAEFVRCSEGTMRRWIAYLANEGLVAVDGRDELAMRAPAVSAVAAYLENTAGIARGFVERERAATLRSV